MLRIALLTVLACIVEHPACAQGLTGRQQEILRTAIAADGWLTEEMHEEFWAPIPFPIRSDPKAIATLTSHLDRSASTALRFQLATWSSIKLTLAAKRASKTLDYDSAKEEMLRASSMPQERIAAEKGASSGDAMIEAAATGRSVYGPQGPFYITQEMTEQVLAGLSGSFHRFRKLANPTWGYKAKEYSYAKEHVRLLWDGPFARETQTITTDGGKSIPVTLLSSRISQRDHVAVGYMQLAAQWLDPEGASLRTAAATLKGMGIYDARPTAGRWRARVAAEAAGSVRTEDGTMYVAVRIVEAREHAAAWQLMAVSGGSLADAIALRNRLELSMQIESQLQGETTGSRTEVKNGVEKKTAVGAPEGAKTEPFKDLIGKGRPAKEEVDESLWRQQAADKEFNELVRKVLPYQRNQDWTCGYGPNGKYECSCPPGTYSPGTWGTCLETPNCPTGSHWGRTRCSPFAANECVWGCSSEYTGKELTSWEKIEEIARATLRGLLDAVARPEIQASALAALLVILVLSGVWPMTQPVQALFTMTLAGGGAYFLATALGVPNLNIDRPWLVGIGLFLLLGAWFGYLGWFSRK